jgi:hypothetical protein
MKNVGMGGVVGSLVVVLVACSGENTHEASTSSSAADTRSFSTQVICDYGDQPQNVVYVRPIVGANDIPFDPNGGPLIGPFDGGRIFTWEGTPVRNPCPPGAEIVWPNGTDGCPDVVLTLPLMSQLTNVFPAALDEATIVATVTPYVAAVPYQPPLRPADQSITVQCVIDSPGICHAAVVNPDPTNPPSCVVTANSCTTDADGNTTYPTTQLIGTLDDNNNVSSYSCDCDCTVNGGTLPTEFRDQLKISP